MSSYIQGIKSKCIYFMHICSFSVQVLLHTCTIAWEECSCINTANRQLCYHMYFKKMVPGKMDMYEVAVNKKVRQGRERSRLENVLL